MMTWDKTFITRWNSKLTTIENYVILRPVLQDVLPHDAPPLLEASEESCVAECIDVLSEARRVARLLEETVA